MAEVKPSDIVNPSFIILIVKGENGQAKRTYQINREDFDPVDAFDAIREYVKEGF